VEQQIKVRGQSKRGSLVETITDTIIGILLSCALNMMIFKVSFWAALLGMPAFTATSIGRRYALRRLFESELAYRWFGASDK
jgi:hypothetical protein